MNLERVEELCLNYLKQAKNPLTPIATLLEYCRRDPEARQLEEGDLLRFLRAHAEVAILEGPGNGETVTSEAFAAGGVLMGPRAILRTRIPDEALMKHLMRQQLDDIEKTLTAALDAEKDSASEHSAQLRNALARAATLKQSLR